MSGRLFLHEEFRVFGRSFRMDQRSQEVEWQHG